MTNHIDVRCFVDDLIANYAKPDRTGYRLPVDSLPDSELHAFAAMIMPLDDDRAAEATGLDNPEYLTKMLPALTKHLQRTTDKDLRLEFIEAWQAGIAKYFMKLLEELIEERLYHYNYDRGYTGERYYENSAHFA